jgi:RING finger/CHY zinc finger protein 1
MEVVEIAPAIATDRPDGLPGCQHYQRRVQLVATCCGDVYTCRHCHNEARYDGCSDPKVAHQMDRTLVQEVVCAACQDRQPVGPQCRVCATKFGNYFCEPCRFYDDDLEKQQFHCDVCVACLPLNMKSNHKCIKESLRVDCPVCMEFLMDSLQTASILKCGHALHTACQRELMLSGSARCPICNASIGDVEARWRAYDQMVAQTPMPHEYRSFNVEILCADCHASSSCIFHIVGLKCGECGGYNTVRTGQEQAPDALGAGGGGGGGGSEEEGGRGGGAENAEGAEGGEAVGE